MADRRKEPERGMKESLLIDGALNDESTPNYMPTSLRMPFLCCMAVYLCALIAMLEFGFHKLPLSQDGDHTSRNDFIGPFVSGPLVAVRHTIKPTPQTSVATPSHLRQDLRASLAVRGFRKYPRWPLNTTTESAILSASLTQPVPTQTPIPDTIINDKISFGNRTFIFSHLPPSETRVTNNGTRRRGIKEPDPGNYADFASRRRIGIMFHLLWRGHTVTGQSCTDDDDCIQNMGVYEGACAGSALVFFDPMGWQALKYQAQREKECRESLTGYDWMAVETELTASKCPGAEVLAIIDGIQPTTGGSSSQVTSITAEVFVVTDENGYGVSSTARLLPTFVTSNTVETFRDSQGRPTRTFVHAVELEQTVVTLQDDSGQPTTTFTTVVPRDAAFETLTDSNGIPTATIEILTLRDPFGLPTATEKYELDSNGSPTAWHELILATLRDSQGDATATAMFEVQELYDDKGVPTATVEVQLGTLRDPQGQPTSTTTSIIGHVTGHPGRVTLT